MGTSMGAAVIWSYLELFGDARIAKAVFVDQAPLQVRMKSSRVRCSPSSRPHPRRLCQAGLPSPSGFCGKSTDAVERGAPLTDDPCCASLLPHIKL